MSFYKRPLPAGSIALSSEKGRDLFREALREGTAEGFFTLAEQFHTQNEPAFCGLGTLVVVLNALAIDPGRVWKGPWRWYTEEHLDCCLPLDEVRKSGVTFRQFACLARCNGARVALTHATPNGLAAFRDAIELATRTAGEPHLVVSYDRGGLGQTGTGHYSPIGAYHAREDQVLILDVARFKYPPHWVSVPTLHQAMQALDPTTQRPRGYALMQRGEVSAAMCNLRANEHNWPELVAQLRTVRDAESLSRVLRAIPKELASSVEFTQSETMSPEMKARFETFVRAVDKSSMLVTLREHSTLSEQDLRSLALLFLALPASLRSQLPESLRHTLDQACCAPSDPSELQQQLKWLHNQMTALEELATQPITA